MIDQDRNLGVTEARFALTIVICVLVAAGYVALLRWGGTGQALVDDGGDGSVVQIEPTPKDTSNDPEVLPVEPPKVSTRPKAPETPRSELRPDGTDFPGSTVLPDESVDSQRR